MNTDLVGIVYEYLRFNDQIKLYKLDKFMYYNLARNVKLRGYNFNDEILKQKRFKNVYTLDLLKNTNITNEGIKHMNLHTLNLRWNKNITDEGIKHMNIRNLYK